jgi:hypothetical protein
LSFLRGSIGLSQHLDGIYDSKCASHYRTLSRTTNRYDNALGSRFHGNSWLPMAKWKGWTDAKYQNSHKEVCISLSPSRPTCFDVPRMLFRLDHQPYRRFMEGVTVGIGEKIVCFWAFERKLKGLTKVYKQNSLWGEGASALRGMTTAEIPLFAFGHREMGEQICNSTIFHTLIELEPLISINLYQKFREEVEEVSLSRTDIKCLVMI